MPVESVTGIWDLDPTWPLGTDNVSQGDDHDRLTKEAILLTWPNITEPVTATASELNAGGTPAGSLVAYGGAAAPSGWLLCDGTAVSRTTYADLYIAIGDAFGAGDGSTTFNLPDMRDRVPGGVSATNELADEAGKDSVTASDMPRMTAASAGAHTHTFSTYGSAADGVEVENSSAFENQRTKTTSSNGAHTHTITNSNQTTTDHRQATLYLNYIIKE